MSEAIKPTGLMTTQGIERIKTGSFQNIVSGTLLIGIGGFTDPFLQAKKEITISFIEREADNISTFVCSKTAVRLAAKLLPIAAKAGCKWAVNATWTQIKSGGKSLYYTLTRQIPPKKPLYSYVHAKAVKLIQTKDPLKVISAIFLFIISILVDPFIFVFAPVVDSCINATSTLSTEVATSKAAMKLYRKCLPKLAFNAGALLVNRVKRIFV